MFSQIIDNCKVVGSEQHSAALIAHQKLLHERNDAPSAPLLNLCERSDDLAEIETLAAKIRAKFKHVIVCGAGGSGLSGRVLTNLTLGNSSPQIYYLDNIDPYAIDRLLGLCPPQDTCVIAISKSGSTVETLSQFYMFLSHFKKQLGTKLSEHFIAITISDESPLRASAREHGFVVMEHPKDIGGRFSVFTSVGLLPAGIAGLNIAAIRQGAAETIAMLGAGEHPARLGASLQYAHMQQGKTITVMLPYCERLTAFSAWYRQSWAESLAKQGLGTTPIRAVGTTDQHSQLQLYLDGPKDKFFTLIFLNRAGTGQKIEAPTLPDLDYIQGKTTGDIMAAEQKATLETLVKNGCPVRLISCEQLNEKTIGAMLMHFMLEIMFMAKLFGVNAFDQPAVEEGKVLAREYLLSGRL